MPLPVQNLSDIYQSQGMVNPQLTTDDNGNPTYRATPVADQPSLRDLYLNGAPDNKTPTKENELRNLYLDNAPGKIEKPAQKIGNRELGPEEITGKPYFNPGPPNSVGNDIKAIPGNVIGLIKELMGNVGSSIAENYQSGVDLTKSGISDISQGNLAPKLPTSNPQDWSGGGILKTGVGGLSTVLSPVSGTIKATVQDPLTNLTGNPDFGEKAGLLVGGVIPFAKGIKIGKAALPTEKAISTLVDSIGGPQHIPEFIKELGSNPRLSPMDISNPSRQLAQKLVVTEGENQKILTDAVKSRMDSMKGTIKGAIDQTMGAPVDVKVKIDSMKDAAREVGSKVINPVLENTSPVDTSSVIKYIDDKAKPGINSVISAGEQLPSGPIVDRLNEIRSYLTDDKTVLTDPKRLNRIQSSLRSEAENLINSTDGQSRSMGYAIMQLRNKIVDTIDEASPKDAAGKGTYRPALGSYADEKHIEDAFEKGSQILKNRPTVFDDRPEYWKAWIDAAKPAEVAAAKEGARIAVDSQIRGMRNAIGRKGVEIPEVEFNVDKMRLLFGKKEADGMFKTLTDEKRIADTNNKLIENSQTAMRLKNDTRVKVRDPVTLSEAGKTIIPAAAAEAASTYLTGEPGVMTAVLTAGAIAKKVANFAGRKYDLANNAELARVLSATGTTKQQVINKLQSRIEGYTGTRMQNTTNLLSGIVGKP